ncbi:hypothetical protein FNW52_03570 [Flavobacterium sp. ZT3R18]|jgi:hypothetical protein|uniref:hypothetical protein n=1 Tax=Flavobacterium sp. ZT3R18 TaxID=2594429 RepID=UPI00117ABC3D|nr:hypothetical protein [Flavobacterium sp. ZT3R18]TRX37990.1 hypothetical protein FNW52_03570 [Flavobacterium sp. ZT3R18]
MSLQIIQNENGKPAGVFIPIKEWKQMKAMYENLKIWEEPEQTEEEILNNIRQAVEEMKLIKAGKLKGRPARELLDEL